MKNKTRKPKLPNLTLEEPPKNVTFEVHDTIKDVSNIGVKLQGKWCECGKDSEFLCYPEDGCCTCGVHKHHVHCAKCGCVSQVG